MNPQELEEFEFRHRYETEHEQAQQQQPRMWDKVKSAVSGAMSNVANNPAFATSPTGLALKAQGAVQGVFDKGGEKVSEMLAGPGMTAKTNPLMPFPFNALPAPAEKGDLAVKTSPEVAAAIGTAVQMTPDIAMSVAPLAEAGLARRANSLATKEAQAGMSEVAAPVKVTAPPARPTAPNLEPLPPEANIRGVSSQAAQQLQEKLLALKAAARGKYAEGLKTLGIDMDQPNLVIRKPEQIQAELANLQAASTPKVSPALPRDPEMEKVFGIPKPEPSVTPAMSDTDRFKQLWQLDKELSQNIKWASPETQQGLFGLRDQIRSELDALPQSKVMNPLRQDYAQYKELTKDLGKPLQDPNQQAALLAKIAKSGFKDVAPVGDAAKANALAKFESQTDSKILDPVKAEFEKDAARKAAIDRNEQVSKLFEKEKQANVRADKGQQKAFNKLSQEQAQQDAIDRRLKDRMTKEEADAIQARKDKISKALKYGLGAVGAYKATKLFHLFGE